MFKSNLITPAFANLIGWRQWHDANETELVLPVEMTESETHEYFQQKHPALQLDVIKATLNPKIKLSDYLKNTVTDATNEIINDLIQKRQVEQYGRTLLERATLLNRYGWKNDTIVNENRFVGFQIIVRSVTGLQAIVKDIGLQFSGTESFTMYLFHTSKLEPVKEIEVTTDGSLSWKWTESDLELDGLIDGRQGGSFILGYYQEDVVNNAINYSNLNWAVGICRTCRSDHYKVWNSIKNHFLIQPIYVTESNYSKGEMFDLNKAIAENNKSWGMNLRFTVECDLTNFLIDNRKAFKNLLAIKVVWRILNDMKFSQQINYIEENLKNMIIRDLEGDIETKLTNVPTQYAKELKAVSYNISSINKACLKCESDGYAPTYGVV